MFIDISWTDTSLSTVDLVRTTPLFLKAIQQKVVRHNDVRSLANVQSGNVYAELAELFHLRDQTFGVNYNAIANNAGSVWVENARGDKAKGKFAVFMHN